MALLWFSLRVRWRRGWLRFAAVALLIGGVGGFILASAASARRVHDTYSALADEIDPPDLALIPHCEDTPEGFGCQAAQASSGEAVIAELGVLAVVEKARLVESLMPYFVDDAGRPLLGTPDDQFGCYDDDRTVGLLALAPGGPVDQSIPFRLDGLLPTPGADGVALTLATARRTGLAIGDPIRLAGWCTGDGDPVELAVPVDLRVTGLTVGPLDIEPPGTGIAIEPAYVERALIDLLIAEGAEPQVQAVVWLQDPSAASAGSNAESLSAYDIIIDFRERERAFDDVLQTDARLLWLLAAIGAVAAALLLTPIVDRSVRDAGRDTSIEIALGSSRSQIVMQAYAHAAVLAVLGAVTAVVLSIPIGAFMPRGFAVAISPEREFWLDAPMVAFGFAVTVGVVIAMGYPAAMTIGNARDGRPAAAAASRRSTIVGTSHLRPAAHSGVLTAIGSPAGRRQVSPWPSLVSLFVAVVACVASMTYLAGLNHFERTPSLVGWNWDAAVSFRDDRAAPAGSVQAELEQVPGVEVITAGMMFPPVFLTVVGEDTTVWPWAFDTGAGAIIPTMISGRAPDGPDETAIDIVFARQSGLRPGDTVAFSRPSMTSQLAEELFRAVSEEGSTDLSVDSPDEPPVVATFEVTGVTVLPLQRTQEFAQASFTLSGFAAFVEPGEAERAAAEAWVPVGLPLEMQADVDQFFANTDIEDRSVYIRLSGDARTAATAIGAIDDVEEIIAPTAEQVLTTGVGLNLVHHHRVPKVVSLVIATAAAALLAFLLATAVRARRGEFAIMRALGLSPLGVRWSIAVQATATAVIPLVLAIPVGVAAGRAAWRAEAKNLDVVPQSVTPWLSLAVVAAGIIVYANLFLFVAGRSATKRSVSADLRAG